MMAGGRIFINYRRDDSRADSGRLYDRLCAHFPGKVFRDVGSLEPGVEWHDAIAHIIGQSDACIVVIGRDWLSITNANGERRLDDPRDTVRQEIVAALERKMRVFPVLVGGAKMPAEEDLPPDLRSLCRRNALEITEQDWDEDLRKLVSALEIALRSSAERPGVPKSSLFSRRWMFGSVGGVVALVVIALVINFAARKPVVVAGATPGSQASSQAADVRNPGSLSTEISPGTERKSSRPMATTSSSTPPNSPRQVDAEPTPRARPSSQAADVRNPGSLSTEISPGTERKSSRPMATSSSTPPNSPREADQASHSSPQAQLSEPVIPATPPPRPAVSSVDLVGSWHAVVFAQNQRLDETVWVYQDHSFIVTLHGELAAAGNLQYDPAVGLWRISDGSNFLAKGIKFSCTWRSNDEGFAGECVDRMRNSWSVLLTREAVEPPQVPGAIPRVDISSLTMAEKVAFSMVLAAARCTCPCGYTVLKCLERDRGCRVSPTLASDMLAAFLRLMRS
jgi:hypothetical protein